MGAVVYRDGVTGTGGGTAGEKTGLQPLQAAIAFGGPVLLGKDDALEGAYRGAGPAADTGGAVQLDGAGDLVERETAFGADLHAPMAVAVEAGQGVPGDSVPSPDSFLGPIQPPQGRTGQGEGVVLVGTGGDTSPAPYAQLRMKIKPDIQWVDFLHADTS